MIVSTTIAAEQTEKVIIIFEDNIDERLVTLFNGDIEETYEHVSAIVAEIPESAIRALEKNPAILSIEVDHYVSINRQQQDWGISTVNAPAAWEDGFTGKGINIAVLDTGIAEHPDLVISGGVSKIPNHPSFLDDNGHGTHVAGIIGARNNDFGIVGVAPEANLFSVKVLDHNGVGLVSHFVAGIDWAIENNMDIVNISLGRARHSNSLKNVVEKAYNKGVLVVAAAGNSGGEIEFPAIYGAAIAVSAINSNHQLASFSARGASIEITAPGVNVLSTYLNNSYARMDGTSMAAPYVTGVLALLKEANPHASHTEIRTILHQTAIDIGTVGRDQHFGYGIAQAPTKLVLKEGDRRPEVIQLKLDLEQAGFFISNNPTNFYGSITTATVADFQRWHGLNPTGVADHETLTKLQEVIRNLQTRKLLKEGDRLPEVIQLKIDLEKVGFQVSSNPTNFYGSVTTRRVREFQRAFNLNPNGVADIRTLDTLRRAVNGEILFLKEGDRRPEVIQLKLDLERDGFFISNNPTNFYGPITTNTVKQFQRKHRLPVDGVAGPRTLQKLAEVRVTLREGDRLPEVIQLKIDLERLGFFISANPTDFYGSITTRTVRDFQTQYGLPATGVADFQTQQKNCYASKINEQRSQNDNVLGSFI